MQTSKANANTIRPGVIVVGPVSIWGPELQSLIEKSFKDPLIRICAKEVDLPQHLPEFEMCVIFCQIRSEADLSRILRIIKYARSHLDAGAAILCVFSTQTGSSKLSHFEQRGVVQVLNPGIPLKTVRLKLEFYFSRMQGAIENSQKKQQKEYRLIIGSQSVSRSGAVVIPADEKKPAQWNDRRKDDPAPAAWRDKRTPEGNIPESPKVQAPALEETKAKPSRASLLPKGDLPNLLLISSRAEDLKLSSAICEHSQSNLHVFSKVSQDIPGFLKNYPGALVLLDADGEGVEAALLNMDSGSKVIVISDRTLSRFPAELKQLPQGVAHSFVRSKDPLAIEVYSKLALKLLSPESSSLDVFFEKESSRQEIQIKRAAHRVAAIGATQNFFLKQGLMPRLASRVSQAIDELLLNAIFSAPVNDEGKRYRADLPRTQDFVLKGRETISLSVISSEHFFAARVGDQFGSLDVESVLANLRRDYSKENYKPGEAEGGLGLNRVLEWGFSLLLLTTPGEGTEVTIFFPRVKSIKKFRESFHFLSAVRLSQLRRTDPS